jgi:ribose transport system permease protein
MGQPQGQRWWIRQLRTLGIATSLILVVVIFSVWTSFHDINFLAPFNVQTMALHAVIISLGAVGMTLIIVSGGIDLSVGSVIALSMVVVALILDRLGLFWLAAVGGVLTGVLVGFLNGMLITTSRVAPFIITLGMMGIARGAAKIVAKNEHINVQFAGWENSWLALLTMNPNLGGTPLPEGTPHLPGWMLLAPSVWLLLFLGVIMSLVLRYTVFGRHIFAIGSNEAAARLCGVRVDLIKVCIYSVAGIFSGVAGVVFCSRQSQGDPVAAVGYELDVIAAVVIGGGSLNGGEGSIFGSIVGALIMVVLRTGLRMLDVGDSVQQILIGAIIIAAVVIDHLQHQRASG